jgi:formylmethanofuran dehydrogenase subunit E-like metal-binding protein
MKLAALTGASLLTLTSAGVVLAATSDTTSSGLSIASRIATKIGFKQDDVQKVLDAQHTIRTEDMTVKMTARLDQLVTDKKITADQKQKILDKQKELQATREANKTTFQNLTQAERKAKMDAARTELETWAKDNGIDIQYIMPFGGGRGHHGMGGMDDGEKNDDASTPSSTSTTN